mmetsp:Transcript_95905/g.266424  ORF Transcript_95905/g.266424 Transcript_95905/m.266424 type:complete len:244 (-) Transcript_95905:848-1579(-)
MTYCSRRSSWSKGTARALPSGRTATRRSAVPLRAPPASRRTTVGPCASPSALQAQTRSTRTARTGNVKFWAIAQVVGSMESGARRSSGCRRSALGLGKTAPSHAAASKEGSSASRRTISGPRAKTCASRAWTHRTGITTRGRASRSVARRPVPRTGGATSPQSGWPQTAQRKRRIASRRGAARTPVCSASSGTKSTASVCGSATRALCTRTRVPRIGTARPWGRAPRGGCRPSGTSGRGCRRT